MTIKFAATMSPDCVTFTGRDGKNHIIGRTHPNNTAIRDQLKVLQKNLNAGVSDVVINNEWDKLSALADVPAFVANASKGTVTVRDGVVYYGDEAIHNTVTERIIWGLSDGFDMKPYLLFLESLMANPSKRAVDELFGFLEACRMGIMEDGRIIAYKRVRDNYTDCHSGKVLNTVGQKPSMARNKVDEDKERTCSYGYHFCSQGYLPHFGNYSASHVMIVAIEPKNVVAIPADYANQKARCCEYEVIGEYTGSDLEDILSAKSIWRNSDVRSEFRPDLSEDENEWNEENDYDYCEACGNQADNCECDRCENCDSHMDDCECETCDFCYTVLKDDGSCVICDTTDSDPPPPPAPRAETPVFVPTVIPIVQAPNFDDVLTAWEGPEPIVPMGSEPEDAIDMTDDGFVYATPGVSSTNLTSHPAPLGEMSSEETYDLVVENSVDIKLPLDAHLEHNEECCPPLSETHDDVDVKIQPQGGVIATFSFEDGLSNYGIEIAIGADGKAVAKVTETPARPTSVHEIIENEDGDAGC